eukprot:3255428-Rhodomonas_salina.1
MHTHTHTIGSSAAIHGVSAAIYGDKAATNGGTAGIYGGTDRLARGDALIADCYPDATVLFFYVW